MVRVWMVSPVVVELWMGATFPRDCAKVIVYGPLGLPVTLVTTPGPNNKFSSSKMNPEGESSGISVGARTHDPPAV